MNARDETAPAVATYAYCCKDGDGQMVEETLTAAAHDGGYRVTDSTGCAWYPSEWAAKRINGSLIPELEALRICVETSSRGEWLERAAAQEEGR